MEKKYLMLLPLAVPLFFGGKAAVTAIKKRKLNTGRGNGQLVIPHDSPAETVVESDIHIEQVRASAEEPHKREEISPIPEDVVNKDARLPEDAGLNQDYENKSRGSKDSPTFLDDNLEERTVFTGPKGGRYYLNKKGKKVYLK